MHTHVKWRHFQSGVILWDVRRYCRYGVGYRDLEQSPEFAALWHSHATGKAIHHGRTSSTYTYATLQFPDNPSLRLAIYSPL